MQRSIRIVLGTPTAPVPPEPKARPRPGTYWRKWRNDGALLSVLLHVLVVAALTVSVPVFGRPAAEETAIPVELVQRAPKPASEEKKPEEKKPEEPKKTEAPKKAPLPEVKKIPEPPKPATPPKPPAPVPASKTVPQPAAPRPQPTPRAAPPMPPAPPPAPTLPEAREPPEPPPIPDAPRPQGPSGGLKVDADVVPAPGQKNGLGYWVLEPLTVNLGHRCGIAHITGSLELKERIGEGRYRGTMHTSIAWAKCPPEGVLHAVELHIKDGEVEMIGADGFIDRGVIGKNTMLLEDRYGRSVWKKR